VTCEQPLRLWRDRRLLRVVLRERQLFQPNCLSACISKVSVAIHLERLFKSGRRRRRAVPSKANTWQTISSGKIKKTGEKYNRIQTLRFLVDGRLGEESRASASDVSCKGSSLRRVRRLLESGILSGFLPGQLRNLGQRRGQASDLEGAVNCVESIWDYDGFY
jgi:hypothetical protein